MSVLPCDIFSTLDSELQYGVHTVFHDEGIIPTCIRKINEYLGCQHLSLKRFITITSSWRYLQELAMIYHSLEEQVPKRYNDEVAMVEHIKTVSYGGTHKDSTIPLPSAKSNNE